jgi:creatinine amidohydrolase
LINKHEVLFLSIQSSKTSRAHNSIIINNHGQLWMLEAALQEFMKRYHLPGIFRVLDWHRAVREFFYPIESDLSLETHFVHADEAERLWAFFFFRREWSI